MQKKLSLYRFLNMFRDIPETDFDIISKHCYIEAFPTGTVLLEEGKVARQLFFVLDGILKITATTEKGIEVIHFFVKEEKFCTILYSFLGGDASRESIITAVNTELVVFTKHDLDLVYKRFLLGF